MNIFVQNNQLWNSIFLYYKILIKSLKKYLYKSWNGIFYILKSDRNIGLEEITGKSATDSSSPRLQGRSCLAYSPNRITRLQRELACSENSLAARTRSFSLRKSHRMSLTSLADQVTTDTESSSLPGTPKPNTTRVVGTPVCDRARSRTCSCIRWSFAAIPPFNVRGTGRRPAKRK